MHFPDDDTGLLLKQMHDEGVDLNAMQTVDFFILFEREDHASGFKKALATAEITGSSTLGTCPDTGVYEVKISVTMVPQYDLINTTEAYFESLADKHNGYGDGWGILSD